MAILIPSKNIYEYIDRIGNNDNKLTNITIEAKKPTIVEENEVVVFDGEGEFIAQGALESNTSSVGYMASYPHDMAPYLLVFVVAKKEWKTDEIKTLFFNKFQGKKIINKVYEQNGRNTDAKIDYTGIKAKGNVGTYFQALDKNGKPYSKDYIIGLFDSSPSEIRIISNIKNDVENDLDITIVTPNFAEYIQKSTEKAVSLNIDSVFSNVNYNFNASISAYSLSTTASLPEKAMPKITIAYDKNDKKYSFDLKTLSYIRDTYGEYNAGFSNKDDFGYLVSGVYEKDDIYYDMYALTSVDVTLYGDTFSLQLENYDILISDDNKKPFIISGSELTQIYNYYDNGKTKTENILKERFKTTLANYQNGKETATLLCSISNYVDDNGYLIKSDKKINDTDMTFNIDDEVIPFIKDENGNDVYMSLKNDGTPKKFSVKGIEFIYDGAVFQKLYLQEV